MSSRTDVQQGVPNMPSYLPTQCIVQSLSNSSFAMSMFNFIHFYICQVYILLSINPSGLISFSPHLFQSQRFQSTIHHPIPISSAVDPGMQLFGQSEPKSGVTGTWPPCSKRPPPLLDVTTFQMVDTKSIVQQFL